MHAYVCAVNTVHAVWIYSTSFLLFESCMKDHCAFFSVSEHVRVM